MPKLHLYTIFHLNLMFSSIEEEQRAEVIRLCYRPLLRLIEEQGLPIGIEAPGHTLQIIEKIDPHWIKTLRYLCTEGPAEFIGSGYAQTIGPLAPAAVNHANQRLGLQTYEELLGFRPRLALVNEQAYSSGLVPVYKNAGYEAIIMEWDNAASNHPEWKAEWRYLPHFACGPEGSTIPVIWNKSIPFQKFQRYAHGELNLEDYLDYLADRIGGAERTFALYGNDAEIFDFRPGRFVTEAPMDHESEWKRIAELYATLSSDSRFSLIRPSQVLDFLSFPEAGQLLHLETPAQPVPVKKQAKYNIVRWALTGRDDLALNTSCWQIFDVLSQSPAIKNEAWKELCYLWSSDFRTHITEARWLKLQKRLARQKALHLQNPVIRQISEHPVPGDNFKVSEHGHFLDITTPVQRLRLNRRRGLAIDGWWNNTCSSSPLVGTLPHGYFDDIHFGADYFTGHFVLESAGQHKITDLCNVDPRINTQNGTLEIHTEIQTLLGPVEKTIRIFGNKPGLQIIHRFLWPSCPVGALRLGHITLHPEAFDGRQLFFRTHNGGDALETFPLTGQPINHLAPVSTLVSANAALGMTSGIVELGDNQKWIRVRVDKAAAALTGHIVFSPVGERFLYRLVLSAMETDDTSCRVKYRDCFRDRTIVLTMDTPCL